MIGNLQALRAYAAISVALFHFSLVPASAMPWHFGSFGVDLFFVLSGFIIAYSADRDSRHFLAHRLIRVLPTYWIVTSLGAAICLLGMPALDVLGWWGQSAAFLTNAQGRPPIIFVGWTLVYELAFYLIFALALGVARKAAPVAAIVLLVLLGLALPLIPLSAATVLRPWPLLLEFAYGIAIFLVTKPIAMRSHRLRWVGLILAVIGLALIYAFDHTVRDLHGLAQQWQRVFALGLPATLVVFGLVVMDKAGWGIKNRFVLALGAASYAIYLLHPPVFFFVLGLKPGPFDARAKIFAILVVATVLVALGFYYAIEKPLLRRLRRLITRAAA